MAVCVEIRSDQGRGPATGAEVRRRREGPGAGSQEDRDGVRAVVAGRYVEMAVAVPVSRDHGHREGARAQERSRAEGERTVAQEDAQAVPAIVGKDRVGLAVLVEVADGDGGGLDTGGEARGDLEAL